MLEQLKKRCKQFFDIEVQPLGIKNRVPYKGLSDWMIRYKSLDEKEFHTGILSNGLGWLNKVEIRDILSKEKEYYFLKTHFLPYDNYLEGEYVIQIVRNPGAVLWSYYNFIRDMKKQYDQDLTSLILHGKQGAPWGGWSEYHNQWIEASKKLKSHYMLIRYEDLFGKEVEFCENLQKRFIGLSIQTEKIKGFEFYHNLRPSLSREGKADDWEKNYSKNQLELLWDIHRQTMTQFGYSEPDYARCKDYAIH